MSELSTEPAPAEPAARSAPEPATELSLAPPPRRRRVWSWLASLVLLLAAAAALTPTALLVWVAYTKFNPRPLVFADLAPGDEFRAVAEAIADSDNEYLGRHHAARLEAQLAQPGLPADERADLEGKLAFDRIRRGDTDGAIEAVERSLAALTELPADSPRRAPVRWTAALVFLRAAEQQNCLGRHCAQSCIFPIERGGVHQRRRAAERARQELEACLAAHPQLPAGKSWLLNVINMTLGEYPTGVPVERRLDPGRFESTGECPRFVDVARELGLGRLSLAGSAAIDDFDGDGLLDVLGVSAGLTEPAALLRNNGRGRFDEVAASGVSEQGGGLHCAPADYDNDGDVDLLILRGAWLMHQGRIRNSLLRNDGGRFTDVTRQAGLAEPAFPTQVGVWGDFDNDGDLDLFVGNESLEELTRIVADHDWLLGNFSDAALARLLPDARFPSQYYRNNGDGTFTEMAAQVGLTNDRWCKGAAAGDYDNDGDLDLLVSNFAVEHTQYGLNRLYQNQGDGTFRDVGVEAGVARAARGFSAWFFDYDNDGWLDLWINTNVGALEAFAAGMFGAAPAEAFPRVYHNEHGRFREVTTELGVDQPWLVMGASFGDLDHDGWLDVYLGTGAPPFETLVPNVMLKNDGGRRFADVTTAGGFGHLQKGHGVAFADLDNDGDQDVYADLGGFFPADRFTKALFLNPGPSRRFLYLRLVGTLSNRQGFGARVRLTVDTPQGAREIHRAVGSVSSFGSAPSRLEIGLGDATAIRELEVSWPKSKIRQSFADVPLDAFLEVVEESGRWARLPLEPLDFAQHLAAAEETVTDLGPAAAPAP